ncbi:unnamed protein product [Brachionus calyciflorus]|uniref:Uncharacterized protein n=1 Tax=Brachionus calyciflorus TaxID=104777 RepID=A0A813URI9_9BILA|nr:unnamed protein product [Brachionus calyciflorus]
MVLKLIDSDDDYVEPKIKTKAKINKKLLLSDSNDDDVSSDKENNICLKTKISTPERNIDICTIKTRITPSSTSSIDIFKTIKYAVVYWLGECSFSIVSQYSILNKTNEPIKTYHQYDISFGNKTYSGLVKFFGSKISCEEILKTITGGTIYPTEAPVKKSAKDELKTKDLNIELKNKFRASEDENLKLKQKLVEFKSSFDELKFENSELKEEIGRLKILVENYSKTFNDKDLLVSLSDKFVDILVKENERFEILKELDNCNENRGTSCFRKILNKLLPESSIFQNNTAGEIKKQNSRMVNAAYQLVKERDSTFCQKSLNLTLNSMVQDSKKPSTPKPTKKKKAEIEPDSP